MKNKINILFYLLLLVGFVLILNSSCNKDEEDDPTPTPTPVSTTVADIDGNVYNTVTIGTQVWMVENLKTTRYRDGLAIAKVTDNVAWAVLTSGAYCNYDNDSTNSATYGRLYNWYAVTNSHEICPEGWHVPTNAEWDTLVSFLGGELIAGGKLKEADTTHWLSVNVGATNQSGFTALPGGVRDIYGSYYYIECLGYWWSFNEDGGYSAWSRNIAFYDTCITMNSSTKTSGFSVRCVKD